MERNQGLRKGSQIFGILKNPAWEDVVRPKVLIPFIRSLTYRTTTTKDGFQKESTRGIARHDQCGEPDQETIHATRL